MFVLWSEHNNRKTFQHQILTPSLYSVTPHCYWIKGSSKIQLQTYNSTINKRYSLIQYYAIIILFYKIDNNTSVIYLQCESNTGIANEINHTLYSHI